MKLNDSETVERLKETGTKLQEPPNLKNELLNLLEEMESILKNIGQGPSKALQDALIPAMTALIADSLIKNPSPDVRILVAVCFNEITRITAPDAPYDDDRMKEVFELIVEAFDNLSALSGRSYDKAVSIIVNVACVRSCVVMLDLDCEDLIIKMFEQFQKNIRSDHPKSVFLAMKTIMTVIIDESESISLELLKVLLNSVRKENEKSLPMSWRLGIEVFKDSPKIVEPLREAISSGLVDVDDYAPNVKAIYQGGSILENEHVSADQAVASKNPVASPTHPVQSGDHAAKSDLGSQSEKRKRDTSGTESASKGVKRSKETKSPRSPQLKPETEHENEIKGVPSKIGRRPSSQDHEIENGIAKKSMSSPRGRPKKNLAAASSKSSDIKSPPKEGGNVRKDSEVLSDSEGKNHQTASVQNKKVGRLKKDSATESGNKSAKNSIKKEMDVMDEPSKKGTRKKRDLEDEDTNTESGNKSAKNSIKKESDVMDEPSKKASRSKRDVEDEEVFETPYGRMKYKEDIIGYRVKVYWPLDKAYYEGLITSYDPIKMQHRVDYDDGDKESLNLRKETFEFTAAADEEDEGEVPIKRNEVPRKESVSPSANKERKKDPATRKQKTPRSSAREDTTTPTTTAAKPSNNKDSKPKTSTEAEGEGKNNRPHTVSASRPSNSKESKSKSSTDAKGKEENTAPSVSAVTPNNNEDSKSPHALEKDEDLKKKN